MRTLLAALFLLAPVTASAALDWTIAHDSGSAVMGEASTIRFKVTNKATSTARLNLLVLQVDKNVYAMEGGIAPPGWTVTTVDKQNRTITFGATGGCPSGLAPGASEFFSLRILGVAVATDQHNEGFYTNGGKSFARDSCASLWTETPLLAIGNPRWSRVGLSAQTSVNPLTLGVGGEVVLTQTVTNRSTVGQSAVAPAAPAYGPTANQFTLLTGPSPAKLTLPVGATGSFQWTLRADAIGPFAFTTSASNGAVSSPQTASPQGSVGAFPALTSVSPSRVTSGQSVDVRVEVSNNGSVPLQQVTPDALTLSGSASVTQLSGPSPAQIDALPPGAAASFSWTYRIAGDPGDDFGFRGTAQAKVDGAPTPSDSSNLATGVVAVHTVIASPASLPGCFPSNAPAARTISYTVINGGGLPIKQVRLFTPDTAYFTVAPSPFVNVPSGWTPATVNGNPSGFEWTADTASAYLQPGSSQRFDLVYSAVGPCPMVKTMRFNHGFSLTLTDNFSARVDAPVTVFKPTVVADVSSLVAISGSGTNTLIWNNPPGHDGVLILRATGSVVSAAPEPGRQYRAGDLIDDAVVAYADSGSFTSSYADQLLTNGTRYYYKVFNHDSYFNYGTGAAPSSAGLFSEPTAGATGAPLWCYSTGMTTMLQPARDQGAAVMTANNDYSITSNLATGGERMRPVKLEGVVGSRFPIVGQFQGRSGRYAVVGDQSGRGYVVNSATGTIALKALGGAPIGERIQAPAAAQLYAAPNAAFQAKYPGRDLIFFATANTANTGNAVVAVSSVTGGEEWRFQPGNLGSVSGYMSLQSSSNRLFVASEVASDSQPSLWVIDTLNTVPAVSLALGDITTGVSIDWQAGADKHALVANSAGIAYGIDVGTLTKSWEVDLGSAPTSFLFPVGGGFVALLASSVQRYVISGDTVTLAWTAQVTGATGMTIDTTRDTVLVGSDDGIVYEIPDTGTGTTRTPIALSVSLGSRVGGPTIDKTAKRLYVGTEDGRLCAFLYPSP